MTAHRNLAKIGMPRLRNRIPRQRLFEQLDALQQYRITWVWGPPGSGKTVLVASYLRLRQPRALWYRVDAEDTDPATFVFYLGEALARSPPRTKRRLSKLAPELLMDLPGFIKRFLNELFRRLPAPQTLVLDNFQEGGAPIEDLLSHACAAIPEGSRLFIVSREAPGAKFARYRANQSLGIVEWDEIKLTRAEAHDIADIGPRLPTEDIDAVWQTCRGWVAGLVILLEHVRRHGVGSLSAAPDEGPVVILDYFASVLFAAFPEKTKRVLLAAALLPQFTADQASWLSEVEGAEEILNGLVRRCLFVERDDRRPPNYRLHPLLRQFLLSAGQDTASGEEQRATYLRAARMAESLDDFETAVALYKEAQDWPELGRLTVEHAPMLLTQGRNQTLEATIEHLPYDKRTRDPWLLYWRGIARMPYDPARARTFLESAYEGFVRGGVTQGCFLACAAILETYFFEWSVFSGEDLWIHRMELLTGEHPSLLDPDTESRVLAAGLALIYRAPGHPVLDDWVVRTCRLLRSTPVNPQSGALGMFVLQFKLWRGRFHEAGNFLDDLNMTFAHHELSPTSLIGLECWTAMHAWNTADFDRAYEFVDRAIGTGQTHGVHVLDALVFGQGVYTALSEQALERAQRFLSAMESALLPIRSLDRGFFFHLRFGYRLAAGDLAGAKADIETALVFAEDAGAPFLTLLNVMGLAMLLTEERQPELALVEIERGLQLARAFDARNIVFAALLLKADALLSLRDLDEAAEATRAALTLGRENTYNNTTPFWSPKTTARVCAFALQREIEGEYVAWLIRARRLPPPSFATDAWPWPVRIFTLGRFSLTLDGKALRPGRKAPKRALELLKVLVALGGRGVGSSNITDLLWPDAEGSAARGAFDMALYRLRKLFGREDAILVHDTTVSLNPECCWVDIWSLERHLSEADTLLRAESGTISESDFSSTVDRILALTHGEFLERDFQQPWMLAPRERIRSRLIRCLMGIGRHFEAAGEWSRAIGFYEQALERQPLAEELYRRLIACHRARGNFAEAVRAYNRCVETLANVLGAQVSGETTALVSDISA